MPTSHNISNLVDLLEERATFLKEKIDYLKAENQSLNEKISALSKERETLKKENLNWKKENEALKIANSILGSNENKTEAKLKINALIREIDACIVQLSKS